MYQAQNLVPLLCFVRWRISKTFQSQALKLILRDGKSAVPSSFEVKSLRRVELK